MRIVIQRVTQASVTINDMLYSRISKGLLILLGIEDADTKIDTEWLCGKISRLRIFADENGVMNKSIQDLAGELLVVSQFTLHAHTKKGNRPSYIKASKPEFAIPIYEQFISVLKEESGCIVKTGKFGAMMEIGLINDGPVTIIMDSKDRDF
jgi:D-tyrosyl-tRNA(Tyr) deacylase